MNKPFDTYKSGEYLAKNPSWDQEDSAWKAERVLDMLSKHQLSPSTLVDIGCGAGGVIAHLNTKLTDTEFSGYDIAPDASQFWPQYCAPNIHFYRQDFLDTASPKYNLLLLLDVFEHVPNPFDFLEKLLLRAEYFIFHIPLDLNAISVARETPLLKVREKVGHIHYYTKGLALALLEESGYDVLDWSYTGANFSTSQIDWKGKLARIPRALLYTINRDIGVRLLGGDTLIVLAKAKS